MNLHRHALPAAAMFLAAALVALTLAGRRLRQVGRLLGLRQEPDQEPGAEGGRGQNEPGETGNVPGWTNTAGAFGAAAYTGFGVGWFNATSQGPKNRGKNYFFGGTSTAATSAHATIGTQTIKLPAAAAGHKATLSGWLGNYNADTAQVRAAFTDASGKVLAAVRIGPDTTIGGSDMALPDAQRQRAEGRHRRQRDRHVHRPRQLQPGGGRRPLAGALVNGRGCKGR